MDVNMLSVSASGAHARRGYVIWVIWSLPSACFPDPTAKQRSAKLNAMVLQP